MVLAWCTQAWRACSVNVPLSSGLRNDFAGVQVPRENNSSKNSSLTEASTKCLAGAQPGIIQKTYLDPKKEGLSDDFSTHKGKLSAWNWQVKVSFYFSHWLHALPPFFLTCLLPLSFPFLLLSSSFSSPPLLSLFSVRQAVGPVPLFPTALCKHLTTSLEH